jgi:RIO kinase 1
MTSAKKTDLQVLPALQWFVDKGLIHEVVRLIKSGKESHVYLTRRYRGDKDFYFVAKVHKPRATRSFKKDKVYRSGWYFSTEDHRIQRAVEHMTHYGRGVVGALWVDKEFEALTKLWRNGASVPTPIHKQRNAILMTYIGEPERPAPKLCESRLGSCEAKRCSRTSWALPHNSLARQGIPRQRSRA